MQGFYPGDTSQKVRAITGYAQGDTDPSVVPTNGAIGTLFVQLGTLNVWQKQDVGRTTNWLPYAPGGGLSTVPQGRTAYVDTVFGNDGTGTVGDVAKPFLTIAAAEAAILTASSINPFVLKIGPGQFDVTGLTKKSFISWFGDGSFNTIISVAAGNLNLAPADSAAVDNKLEYRGLKFSTCPIVADFFSLGGVNSQQQSFYDCQFDSIQTWTGRGGNDSIIYKDCLIASTPNVWTSVLLQIWSSILTGDGGSNHTLAAANGNGAQGFLFSGFVGAEFKITSTGAFCQIGIVGMVLNQLTIDTAIPNALVDASISTTTVNLTGGATSAQIILLENAELVGYAPAVPADWAVPPSQVAQALDELAASGGGAPGAPADSVQFNDAGSFGGDADFTFQKTPKYLQLGSLNPLTSGTRVFVVGSTNTAIQGTDSIFVGGALNITADVNQSLVVGSSHVIANIVSESFILGDNHASSSGFSASLLGGTANDYSGTNSLVAGDSSTYINNNSVAAGQFNSITADRSLVAGFTLFSPSVADSVLVGSASNFVTSVASSLIGGTSLNVDTSVSSIVSGAGHIFTSLTSSIIAGNGHAGTTHVGVAIFGLTNTASRDNQLIVGETVSVDSQTLFATGVTNAVLRASDDGLIERSIGGLRVKTRIDGGAAVTVDARTDYSVISTSAASNINLPAGVDGMEYKIKSVAGSTINPNGADTIDGNPSLVLAAQEAAILNFSTGVWYVMAGY